MSSLYKSASGQSAVETFYRKGLALWPVPHREMMLPTCEGDTFVIVSGEQHQTPVVLLHGSGSNSLIWMRDVADLSRHFRVYAIDLIGEPGFSAPSRPAFESDAYARWLDDVWNQIGLTRANIVGVSLGGWIAVDYAVRRPSRVSSLSLLSPAGIGRQNPWFMAKAAVMMMLGKLGLRRSLQAAGGSKLSQAATSYVMLIFQHFRPRMDRLPLRTDRELASLTLPVHVTLGAKDAMLRADETRDRMRRLVPHSEIVYLHDAGHFLPPQTNTLIEFLQSVTTGSRPLEAAAV